MTDDHERQYQEEKKDLERRYQMLFQELYRERFEILAPEEIFGLASSSMTAASAQTNDAQAQVRAWGDQRSSPEDHHRESSEPAGTVMPKFWLLALKSHCMFAQMIEPHDEPVLAHLLDIAYEPLEEESDFAVLARHGRQAGVGAEAIVAKQNQQTLSDSRATMKTLDPFKAAKNPNRAEAAAATEAALEA